MCEKLKQNLPAIVGTALALGSRLLWQIAGLVDVKVVSFSATHTALKLVIPLARR